MVRVGNPKPVPDGRSQHLALSIILFIRQPADILQFATLRTASTNDIDVLDKVRSLDILPRQPQQVNGLSPIPASEAARRFTTAPR